MAWVAQQTAPGAFAVNDRSGAPKIQVDGGDGILLKLPRRANERRDVIADHLGHDGFAGRIMSDRLENVTIQGGSGMHPEVLSEINVRAAILRHECPKRQVGHVLHRGECQDGSGTGQQLMEITRHVAGEDNM